jgi:hypothetical protein
LHAALPRLWAARSRLAPAWESRLVLLGGSHHSNRRHNHNHNLPYHEQSHLLPSLGIRRGLHARKPPGCIPGTPRHGGLAATTTATTTIARGGRMVGLYAIHGPRPIFGSQASLFRSPLATNHETSQYAEGKRTRGRGCSTRTASCALYATGVARLRASRALATARTRFGPLPCHATAATVPSSALRWRRSRGIVWTNEQQQGLLLVTLRGCCHSLPLVEQSLGICNNIRKGIRHRATRCAKVHGRPQVAG